MDQQQCIFCGIATGGVPSKKIFEDDKVTVVLDIYPANPAHLLVLTKNHYAIFNQLSKDEATHLGIITKRISELMFKVLKPEGINFFIANGAVAGQKAPHFILHVIPRFSGDGLNFNIPVKDLDEDETDALYQKMKGTLKNYFPEVDFDNVVEPEVHKEEPAEEKVEQKEEVSEEKAKLNIEKEIPADEEKEPEKENPEPVAEQKEETEEPQQKKDKDDVDLDKITEMFS